ncbi:tyrosine-type recombinase/integrase [Microtetraspora niveoalba]|uniref:tyrosine-type recombinase/integrase n=1 Tax=Microtetraspora niveoalba TaxID=46175 RepID=UPI000AB6559B|nr:tyrosine-type recombinase/integrase [Microtetraspora niveoalba]
MASGSRKPNGRSSVYLGKDGKWHGWVTMGVKDNGAPDRRHRVGSSEAEVTRKIRELEKLRDAGKTSKPGRKPTVEQWMSTYLDTICARLVSTGKMAPRTLDDYRSKNKNWIVPHLGRHRLDRLTPEHLDRLYVAMAEQGKAESHILKVHRIISRALEIAMRRDQVGRNVAKLVEPPGSGDVEIEPLSRTDVRKILDAVTDRRNGTRWVVGLALGLRQGEALGLRWKYVDLDAHEVKIWWQIQRTKWQHGCGDPQVCTRDKHRAPCPKDCAKHQHREGCAKDCGKRGHVCPEVENPCPKNCTGHASTCPRRQGGGLGFRRPKSNSKRVIPLPDELVPLLKGQQEAQDAEREAAGESWEENDLVYSRPDGRPIDPRHDWEEWKEILKEAGVRDARVHDGRHTAGTLLIDMGVHVRTVMEVLGHSDIRVTQRYTHVATPMARDAVRRMGRALWD